MDDKQLALVMTICMVLNEQAVTPAAVEEKYFEACRKIDEYRRNQGRLPLDEVVVYPASLRAWE